MKPTISVIIPVYNVVNYLAECIASLLQQIPPDAEVLLVDDGSTDGSSGVCDHYESIDSRVRVIHKKNGGVSSARNEGLALASGKYVTFVDSDDLVTPDYFIILKKAVKRKADLYHFRNLEYVSEKKRYLIEDRIPNGMHRNLDEIYKAIVQHRFCLVWDKIYRKEILDRYGIRFDCSVKSGEDLLFNMDYLYYAKRVYIMKEHPYIHRSNPEGVRNNPRLSHIDDLKHIYEKSKEFIANKKAYSSYYHSLNESMLWILSYSLIPGLVSQRINAATIKERIRRTPLYEDLVKDRYSTMDCKIFRILLMHHLYSLLSYYRFWRVMLVKLFKNKLMQME